MKISREDWREIYLPEYDENLPGFLKIYSADDLITTKEGVDPHYIWTELSDSTGTVVPGARFVDRFCYYISENPWRDADYHDLEVTDLITKADYAAAIAAANDDGDEDLVEILLMQMEDEFGGSDE